MNEMTVQAAPTLWERWGAALGILSVVLLVGSFVLAAGGPSSTEDDATIVSWYSSNSHQNSQIFGFLGFAVGVLCLICFLALLRERSAAAEQAPGGLSLLAFATGIASAMLFLMAIALFAIPAFTATDTSPANVVPETYRVLYTAASVTWIAATMMSALTVAATTAVAFRTGFLPGWFGWLGVLVGVALLAGFFFVPAFAFLGWVLIASVLLIRRTSRKSPATAA